jgi:hypothetical protein
MQDDVVRLATTVNPAEAHLWCNALEAEGIQCKVVGDLLEGALGGTEAGKAEVWVRRDDLARAQALLDAHQKKQAGEGKGE